MIKLLNIVKVAVFLGLAVLTVMGTLNLVFMDVVEKTERLVVIEKLKKGLWLAEGRTNPSAVKILKRGHNESSIQITIRQGRNRQIRRMLAKLGLSVKSLSRTKIGKITTRGIGIGKFRHLTKPEIEYLYKITAD